MRKYKQIILTILISCALLALALAVGNGRATDKAVNVLAATGQIPAGTRITAEQLKTVKVPENIAADCYYPSASAAIGLWTTIDISAGELISSSQLSQTAAGLKYPDAGQGRRLLTLDLNPADANGFWLSAGSRIDLYLIPKGQAATTDIRILENIRIMAVLPGDSSQPLSGVATASPSSGGLICLDVNNEQARLIIGAINLCDIRLAAINEPPLQEG